MTILACFDIQMAKIPSLDVFMVFIIDGCSFRVSQRNILWLNALFGANWRQFEYKMIQKAQIWQFLHVLCAFSEAFDLKEMSKMVNTVISLRAFGRSGYCDHQRRRRCRCRCRWCHTFVPRQNLRTAIAIDLLFFKWLVWIRSRAQSKKMGLRMGKALGKIDFLRFLAKNSIIFEQS